MRTRVRQAEETDGSVESSQIEEEQESIEQVESSSNDEQQEIEKEIEEAGFTWNVSDQDLYVVNSRGLEVKPSWFLGTVTYSDGTVGSIDADEVELKQEGDILKVIITFRGEDRVGYEIEIPEIWEDSMDNATEDEIGEWYEGLGGDSSVIDESNMSGSVIKEVDSTDFLTQYGVTVDYIVSYLEGIGYVNHGIDVEGWYWDSINSLCSGYTNLNWNDLDISNPDVAVPQIMNLGGTEVGISAENILMYQCGLDPFNMSEEDYSSDNYNKYLSLSDNFPWLRDKEGVSTEVNPFYSDIYSEDEMRKFMDDDIRSKIDAYSKLLTEYTEEGKDVSGLAESAKFEGIYDYVFGDAVYVDIDTHISIYGIPNM